MILSTSLLSRWKQKCTKATSMQNNSMCLLLRTEFPLLEHIPTLHIQTGSVGCRYLPASVCSSGLKVSGEQSIRRRAMGLLPDTQNRGLCMRWECRERFHRHRFQRKPLVNDIGMHHGTFVTHVPWCMSGSLTRDRVENGPGIPGACATRNFTYLARGPWHLVVYDHWACIDHVCLTE